MCLLPAITSRVISVFYPSIHVQELTTLATHLRDAAVVCSRALPGATVPGRPLSRSGSLSARAASWRQEHTPRSGNATPEKGGGLVHAPSTKHHLHAILSAKEDEDVDIDAIFQK